MVRRTHEEKRREVIAVMVGGEREGLVGIWYRFTDGVQSVVAVFTSLLRFRQLCFALDLDVFCWRCLFCVPSCWRLPFLMRQAWNAAIVQCHLLFSSLLFSSLLILIIVELL